MDPIPKAPMKKKVSTQFKQNMINDRTRRQLFKKTKTSRLLNAPMKPKNQKILVNLTSARRKLF